MSATSPGSPTGTGSRPGPAPHPWTRRLVSRSDSSQSNVSNQISVSLRRAREGTAERLENPARSTCPPHNDTSDKPLPGPAQPTLRRPRTVGRPTTTDRWQGLLDTKETDL